MRPREPSSRIALRVRSVQVEKAVNALFAFVRKKQLEAESGGAGGKQDLFEQQDDFNIIIGLKRTPERARVKPIPL